MELHAKGPYPDLGSRDMLALESQEPVFMILSCKCRILSEQAGYFSGSGLQDCTIPGVSCHALDLCLAKLILIHVIKG